MVAPVVKPSDPPDSTTGRWLFKVEARTRAAPSQVWPLLGEAERWKDWSFLTSTFLMREGAPDPNGLGALRRLARGRFGSSEEVVAWDPPGHLGYVARKGLPVRGYRADVRLTPDGAGTAVTWTGSVVPLVPGTGALVLMYTRGFVRRFASELTRFTDRLADGSAG